MTSRDPEPSSELWDVLAQEAADESSLWRETLLPVEQQRREPVFSTLCGPVFALGVETIYEGYLLHYGTSRLFAPPDDDTALLLGDYLYAHGLVRIAATGSTAAVRDLAELISLCSQAQASRTNGDEAVWAATSATLGDDMLDDARAALRDLGDSSALERVARTAAGDDAVDSAVAVHHAVARQGEPAVAPGARDRTVG
jgi:hypothetical protein